ncbi:hypothetical protein PsYK624_101190 [Phanerochaete sordida]|uniref:Nephrocystin 3-like N-terminal domain-containing protein n=1 Tax=Phanerochaete sordida TaxID=48140 RepID=A0A9P3GFH1_9APHY|nr:hypothetical protein PsYK624_101190 [Phanerochaete sordida]
MPQPRRRGQAFDDALNVLSTLADIAGVAADAGSVPALKPVVSTLSIVIKRVKDVRTNSETEVAFFEKTKRLGEVIIGIMNEANKGPERGRAMFQERLNGLTGALDEIQGVADGLTGGRGFRGSVKRFFFVERNKDILAKMNEQLAVAMTMFSLATQGATENAVHRVEHVAVTTASAVHRVEHITMDAAERKIIDDIPHADAGYLSVKEVKSGFMEGTRKQTFGALKAWTSPGVPARTKKLGRFKMHRITEEREEIKEPLFLLTAGAGLGKSAIAHQLCLRLSDPKQLDLNLGASFFFSRGGIDSAHSLFSTVARQLALTQPRIRPIILKAARSFLDGGKEQQVRRTFEELLLKPLMEQPDGTVLNDTTFVVIDGLDECKDRALIPELLRCLLDLVRGVPWLRVFLATRPEPHILPVLTSQSAAQIVHHLRLDDPQTITESKESVELYLRQTIPEIYPYGDFVRANPDKFNRLIDRANGLFIYARVAVKHLEMYNTRPKEQFTLLLNSGGVGLSPLDELYLQVLQSAFPPKNLEGSPDMRKRLHDFLTFIALHNLPLPPAAISLLLTLTDDDVLWMAGRLRAVLLVNEDRNLVPLHATFEEFLVDSKRCVDALYHVDPPMGHALLASKCLAAYNFDTVTLYLRSQSYSSTDGHSTLDSSIILSWYSYILYWDSHLKLARSSDELQQQVRGMPQIAPIMARLHNPYMRNDVDHIQSFVQDPEEAAAICNEYVNSRLYYELWWRRMAGDYTARRAASVTLAELESKWESYKAYIKNYAPGNIDEYSFSIQAEDVTRYTAILQGLVDTIRDSGTGELWYNLEIGQRGWDPI